MNLCLNCGVELEDDIKQCPLCGKNTGELNEKEKVFLNENYPSGIIQLHKKEIRRYIWELSGIITFSGIAVCTIVDLIIGKGLLWSLYSDSSILGAWICLTIILVAFKNYFIIIPGLLISILTVLFLFDLISPSSAWFFPVGLPVTIAVFVLFSSITVLWKIAHFRGFNILAFAFLLLSGFCIITEVFIDNYLYSSVDIKWSAIVAVSLFPIAMILLFVHYRMKRGKNLNRYFHI